MSVWRRSPYRLGLSGVMLVFGALGALAAGGAFSSHSRSSSDQPSYSGKVSAFLDMPRHLRAGRTVQTTIRVRNTGAAGDAVVALTNTRFWKVQWIQAPDLTGMQTVSDSFDPDAKAWDLGPLDSDLTVLKLKLTAMRPGNPHLSAVVYGGMTPDQSVDIMTGVGDASWHGAITSSVDAAWHRLGVRPVPADLYAPSGVAVDARGRILVADGNNDRVVVFSPTGQILARWSPQTLGFAWGVAAGPAGTTYVNGRGDVFKLNVAGRQVAEYDFATDFDDFDGVVVAPSGRLYLPETNNGGGVVVLNGKGQQIATWGDGEHGYSIARPGQPAVDPSGNILVPDAKTATIAKVSPSGRLLGRIGASAGLRDPEGVALDAAGNLYVVETAPSQIVKLTPTGKLMGRWGTAGYGPGQLDGPSGVAIDRAGRIYIADSGNDRIVVLSPAWRPIGVWGW